MSSTVLSPSPVDFPKSTIRRKPTTTYKSPSANDTDPRVAFTPRCASASTSTRPRSGNGNIAKIRPSSIHTLSRKSVAKSYTLPLYHPLGDLAQSLPPLNPADFGLPLPRLAEATSRKSSANSRRGSTKPLDVDEEEDVSVPTVSSIAAVAANEVKRASPRKRRGGAGNGKRRRREVDDGDATYPAKRTRQTRGGGDDHDFEDAAQAEGDGTPDVDGPAERRPERRSTRSRTKRRDSSEVESPDEQHAQDTSSVLDDNVKPAVTEEISGGTKGEKEEGEINGTGEH